MIKPHLRTVLAALAIAVVLSAAVLAFADKDHAFVNLALVVVPVAWGALTSVVVWWLRGRNAGRGMPAEAAADWLAGAVVAKWRREAEVRRITTPAAASVRWRWTASDLTVPRSEASMILAPGTGPARLPDLGQPGRILAAGVVTRLHDEVYARLPHGRLVLVGGPGAGKTGAMVMLLLAALDWRDSLAEEIRSRVPVPVWLTLGSWNPASESIHEWVTGALNRDYPALRAPGYGADAAGRLVRDGRVALFLDGLDEMPEQMRSAALTRLNAEASGLRTVITSRLDEYQLAVQGTSFDNAAVIELCPVRPRAAAAYLLLGQSGPARARWERLGDYLRSNPSSVAAKTLNNPLTLSLARDAYKGGDPVVMTDPSRFPSVEMLTRHLIDRFMVTAYPGERQRAHAIRWLSWIAWHMGSSEDLQWWDIPHWVPPWQLRVARGLATGLTVGILVTIMALLTYGYMVPGWAPARLSYHLAPGIAAGTGLGLMAGLVARLAPRSLADAARAGTRRGRDRVYALSWLVAGSAVSALLFAYNPGSLLLVSVPVLLAFYAVQAWRSWRPGARSAPVRFLERRPTRTACVVLALGTAFGIWTWLDDGFTRVPSAVIQAAVYSIPFAVAFGFRGSSGFGLAGAPQAFTPRWSLPARLLPCVPVLLALVSVLAFLPVTRGFEQSHGEIIFIAVAAVTIFSLLLIAVLVVWMLNSWAVPAARSASATASGTYKADRRTSITYACIYTAIAGIPLGIAAGSRVGPVSDGQARLVLVLGWTIASAVTTWILAWFTAGQVPLVALTQLVLRLTRGHVSFMLLLERASQVQVLRQAGTVYQFRHAALKAHLSAIYQESKGAAEDQPTPWVASAGALPTAGSAHPVGTQKAVALRTATCFAASSCSPADPPVKVTETAPERRLFSS